MRKLALETIEKIKQELSFVPESLHDILNLPLHIARCEIKVALGKYLPPKKTPSEFCNAYEDLLPLWKHYFDDEPFNFQCMEKPYQGMYVGASLDTIALAEVICAAPDRAYLIFTILVALEKIDILPKNFDFGKIGSPEENRKLYDACRILLKEEFGDIDLSVSKNILLAMRRLLTKNS